MTDDQQPTVNRMSELPDESNDQRPGFARNDVADLCGSNPILLCDDMPIPTILADLTHIVFGQFGVAVNSTGWMGAVRLFVSRVFKGCLPRQVRWRDTTKMASPAGVRRLVSFCRWRSPSFLTDHSCDHLIAHHCVTPPAAPTKRPIETSVGPEGQNHFAVEAINFMKGCLGRTACNGIAVAGKAVVVQPAKSACVDFLAALVNSAYTKGSHSLILQDRVSVRTRRSARTLGGFAFCTTPDSSAQWVLP